MNTKIEYLYRDASNYKVWNAAVVEGTLTEEQKGKIYDCLEDGESFVPHLVGLPEKTFVDLGYSYDEQDDTPYFELGEGNITDVHTDADTSLTAQELYENFLRAKDNWAAMLAEEMRCAESDEHGKKSSSFEMTAFVSGYVTMTFDVDTEEEGREAFEQYLSDADFGPLHDIDWDSDNIRTTKMK